MRFQSCKGLVGFHTSRITNKLTSKFYSTDGLRAVGVEKDSQYPGLYYYQFQKDNKPAGSYISFVPPESLDKESSLSDRHIIAKIKALPEGLKSKNIPLEEFQENRSFMSGIQDFLKKNVAVSDHALVAMAEHQKEGWIHIVDHRNPPAYGRIPDPEDIFGSLLAVKGVLMPETYQIMPTHRPLTSQNGLFQLPEGFREALLKELLR